MIESLGSPPDLADHDAKLLGGLLILISSWGVAGNLLMMTLLLLSGVWNVTNILLFYLSLVDFIQVMLCILPLGVSGMLVRWPFGEVLCEAFPSIHDSLQMTGSYIVLLICLNRVYALHWPVHYTQYKRALARTTPWLILALCLLPYLVFEPAVLVFRHHHNYTTAVYSPDLLSCVENTWSPKEQDLGFLLFNIFKLVCLFVLPYLLTILAYLYMTYLTHQARALPKPNKVKLSASFIRVDKNTLPLVDSKVVTMELPDYNPGVVFRQMALWDRAERATTWILSMMVLGYILSLLPKAILLCHQLAVGQSEVRGRLFYNIIQYAEVIVNPVLYTMQYNAIKEQLQKIGHRSIY